MTAQFCSKHPTEERSQRNKYRCRVCRREAGRGALGFYKPSTKSPQQAKPEPTLDQRLEANQVRAASLLRALYQARPTIAFSRLVAQKSTDGCNQKGHTMNKTLPKDYTVSIVCNSPQYDMVKMQRKESKEVVIRLRNLADVDAARFAIELFETRNGK